MNITYNPELTEHLIDPLLDFTFFVISVMIGLVLSLVACIWYVIKLRRKENE